MAAKGNLLTAKPVDYENAPATKQDVRDLKDSLTLLHQKIDSMSTSLKTEHDHPSTEIMSPPRKKVSHEAGHHSESLELTQTTNPDED